MRSNRPMPGNPWPHDMVITVEDHPSALLELLWVREAWRLEPEGSDLPPKLTDPPALRPVPAGAPVDGWVAAWPGLWEDVLGKAAAAVDRDDIRRLMTSADGSDERADLLGRLHGPSWHERFGDEALPEEFHEWNGRFVENLMAHHGMPLAESPERMSLDALIGAWSAGVTKIVEIPCRGDFTRVIGPHALLLTAGTRADPLRYAAALGSFG